MKGELRRKIQSTKVFRNKTLCWRFRNPRKLRINKVVTNLAVKDKPIINSADKDSTAEGQSKVKGKIWKLVTSELSVELENGRINELDVLFAPDEICLTLTLPKAWVHDLTNEKAAALFYYT